MHAQQLGVADHAGQRVVQLVGHAGHDLAQTGQPLGLGQAFLHTTQLGHVTSDPHASLDLAVGIHQLRAGQTDIEALAVEASEDDLTEADPCAFAGRSTAEVRAEDLG